MVDKKKLKGMEHLSEQIIQAENNLLEPTDNQNIGHKYLKKELTQVIVITSILILILALLYFYDQKYNGLEKIASYLMSQI